MKCAKRNSNLAKLSLGKSDGGTKFKGKQRILPKIEPHPFNGRPLEWKNRDKIEKMVTKIAGYVDGISGKNML